MKSIQPVQYTIRGIPPSIDKELRRMAQVSGRSLNKVVVETLQVGTNTPPSMEPDTSLDDLFGLMSKKDAALLEEASQEARSLHPKDYQ